MRRRLTATLAALGTLVLTACATLPTAGPVNQGMTQAPTSGTIQYEATGPAEGAGPTEIVDGFLQAGAAGLSGDNDFEVARAYLTSSASTSWDPLSQVLISANESPQVPVLLESEPLDAGTPAPEVPPEPSEEATLDPEQVDDLDRVRVRLSVVTVADVDVAGVYTAATAQTPSELTYELVRTDGQWRIASLPGGLLLTEVAFGNVFRSVPVMFLTPDLSTLVPDVRFVPNRNAASHALDLLVGGPAPWLAPGVTTRVQDGMQLEQPGAGVVVSEGSGEAEVRLTGGDRLTESDRVLLHTQVAATLQSVPGIQSLSLWLEGAPYEPRTDAVTPRLDVEVGDVMTAISDGALVQVSGTTITPVPGPAGGQAGAGDAGTDAGTSGTGAEGGAEGGTPADGAADAASATAGAVLPDLHQPAPAYASEDGIAVLQGSGTLLHVAPDGVVTTLHTGADLIAPTQDRLGWVLTGERANTGELAALRPGTAPVRVEAEAFAGTLTQVRVSRDGARAVVMRERDGRVEVVAAAVVRDSSGAPVRLTPGPVLLGGLAVGVGVVWADSTGVAVLAALESGSIPGVRSVLVSGPVATVSSTAQATSIAAAAQQLYLATSDARLLRKVSLRWEEVTAPVTDPAFPG